MLPVPGLFSPLSGPWNYELMSRGFSEWSVRRSEILGGAEPPADSEKNRCILQRREDAALHVRASRLSAEQPPDWMSLYPDAQDVLRYSVDYKAECWELQWDREDCLQLNFREGVPIVVLSTTSPSMDPHQANLPVKWPKNEQPTGVGPCSCCCLVYFYPNTDLPPFCPGDPPPHGHRLDLCNGWVTYRRVKNAFWSLYRYGEHPDLLMGA